MWVNGQNTKKQLKNLKKNKEKIMSDFLKGNFKTENKITGEEKTKKQTDELEDQFEKEALKHLGGSIAFVSKRKVMWEEKEKLNKKTNDPKKK